MAIFNSFLYVYQRVDHSAHKFLVARLSQCPFHADHRALSGTSQVSTGIPDHPLYSNTAPSGFLKRDDGKFPTLRLYKWWSHLKRTPFSSGISQLTMFDYRYKHRWILPSGTGVSLLADKSSQWWSVLLTFTNWSNPPNIHPHFIPHIHHAFWRGA